MDQEFVERRDESFYLTGSRVPLARIVREFLNGESAEVIRAHFPALTIEQVHGAIAFYLEHRSEVEQDVNERNRRETEFTKTHRAPAQLKKKLERARQPLLTPRT